MFRYPVLLVIVLLSCALNSNAQEKDKTAYHNIAISGGYMAYMTSFAYPSGIPGNSLSFLYSYERTPPRYDNRLFYLSARGSYAWLQNKKLPNAYLIRYFNADINCNQLWRVMQLDKKLTLFFGAGLSLNGYKIYPKNVESKYQIYGNWGLATDFIAKAEYSTKPFKIENYLHIPVVKGGHFPLYQTFPEFSDDDNSNILTPNTLAWIGNYLHIKNDLKVVFPFKKINMLLLYSFVYQHSTVNKNKERFLHHAFGLGVRF